MMHFSVVKVEPRPDFVLLITFKNGELRQFDMKPYLDMGVFKALREQSMFNSVHVSFNSIAWDNDADFDPEALYEKSEPVETVLT